MGRFDPAVLAGTMSTLLFVVSCLPMLLKAWRTRDLSSYSVVNLAVSNIGNLVHTLYVVTLPVGPIWALHAFYVVSSALMLWWWFRYQLPLTRDEWDQRPAESGARRSHVRVEALGAVQGDGAGRPKGLAD